MNQEEFRKESLYELKKKSPGVAVGLSLIVTGAGSMYVGKIAKGIGILLLQFFLWIFILGWIMWIVAPIVAYYDALNYNKIIRLEMGLD